MPRGSGRKADFRARWKKFRGWRAMLCFPQMATKAQITAEQYLHMTFEHDAEYVHGEIVERSMPDYASLDNPVSDLARSWTLDPSHPLFPVLSCGCELRQTSIAFPTFPFSQPASAAERPRHASLGRDRDSVQGRPPSRPHGKARRVSRLGRSEHLGRRSRCPSASRSTPSSASRTSLRSPSPIIRSS